VGTAVGPARKARQDKLRKKKDSTNDKSPLGKGKSRVVKGIVYNKTWFRGEKNIRSEQKR